MGCIYMYTNLINGKKYIGQTVNDLQKRHSTHLCGDLYIDRAIKKYGMENFKLEVLEDNIFDQEELNEKEKYYIKKYDTFSTGYNLTYGGEGGARFDNNDAVEIISLIQNTDMTFEQIGEQTGYSIYTVSEINNGNTAKQPDVTYPIRENRCTQKYTLENATSVIDLLKSTEYSFSTISKMVGVDYYFVSDINRGKVSNADYSDVSLPIRPLKTERPPVSIELAKKIIVDLKEMRLSNEEISVKYNLPANTVGSINRGTHSICKKIDEEYPIRKRQYRNKIAAQNVCAKLSVDQVKQIVSDILNTTCSFEELARRYNVSRVTIDRINRKETWANVTKQFQPPIRTNPYNNQFRS